MKSVGYGLRVWAGIPNDVTYQLQDPEQATECLCFISSFDKMDITIVFTS